MSGRGNLTEYLILCLNTVCGYWRREGEALPNPGVLMPEAIATAQALPARRGWGFGEKLRVRNLVNCAAGLPTAALPEEILLEGEGQIRALICIGGNPAVAWPDQQLALEALQKLELCVTIDIKMSATARQADYVIAPRLSFEVPGTTHAVEAPEQMWVGVGYPTAYGQYAPALIDPPEGSDVIEEWDFFYGLAKRQGLPLSLYPIRAEAGPIRELRKPLAIDMENKPTTDELLELIFEGSRIPLSELKEHPGGAVFDGASTLVGPKEPGWEGRLELADTTMLSELAELREESLLSAAETQHYPFRLISRRTAAAYNSSGRDLPSFERKRTDNPAYLNPDDLRQLGLESGDVVRIESDRGSILGVLEAAPDVRRGVISMTHAYGEAPDRDHEFRKIGSTTGRLVNCQRNYDPYSGMPRMSSIAVRIKAVDDPANP